ncbi:MAG: AAA family ATPase, partial [Erysipelotrichaceae bacterium]
MLFKSTIKLNQSLASLEDFNITNQEISNRISNEYSNQSRIMAVGKADKELYLVMVINEKHIQRLNAKTFSKQYMEGLSLEAADMSIEELTNDGFWDALQMARNSKKESDAITVDRMVWMELVPQIRGSQFVEKIVRPDVKESLSIYSNSFALELARIKQNRHKVFLGHPVHYVISGNNTQLMRRVSHALVRNLEASKRLFSLKTVAMVEGWRDLDDITDNVYDVMEVAKGSTMIIDLREILYDGIGLRELNNFFEVLSKIVVENCHKILFIFYYEAKEDQVFSLFMDYIEGINFVNIEPALMNYKQASIYLKEMVDEIQGESELFIQLLDKDQINFNETEIDDLFRQKHNQLLKSDYFPEYSQLVPLAARVKEPEGKAYKELMSLIGLDKAKELVEQFITYQKALPIMAQNGISNINQTKHMLFTGNPGTAKTTVARLIGKIMKENGILTVGGFVEMGRSQLVGEYLGQTAVKVKKAFKRARGGVLFIDEAYSLVDDRDGLYGDEALATIVQEMENLREDIIVIFAGYTEKMKKFIEKNPGLKSRISFTIDFQDYSLEELEKIAQLMVSQRGYRMDEPCLQKLRVLLEEGMKISNYGNGRYVRNLIEEAILHQTNRLYGKADFDASQEDLTLLKAEDMHSSQKDESE